MGSWAQQEGESPTQVAWGSPELMALSGSAVVQIAIGYPLHVEASDGDEEKHAKHILENCDLSGENTRHQP